MDGVDCLGYTSCFVRNRELESRFRPTPNVRLKVADFLITDEFSIFFLWMNLT